MVEKSSKYICVFCGSANGAKAEYPATARELGLAIAGKGYGLVYGGATAGLMGVVADAALSGGGKVIGVLPDVLMDREIAHRGLTELHTVHTMHERKALMASRADAFVALPGGFGTMDEFLEILTWSQLRIHSKPCVLLNVGGYYDALLQFLDHAVEQGFLKTENRQRVLVTRDVPETLAEIERAWGQIETPVHDPKLDELVK